MSKYVCEQCGKEYKRSDHYEKHLEMHKQENLIADRLEYEKYLEEHPIDEEVEQEDYTIDGMKVTVYQDFEDDADNLEEDIKAFVKSMRGKLYMTRPEQETLYRLYNKRFKTNEKNVGKCSNCVARLFAKLKRSSE